jgi:hypothetical protein
MRRASHLSRGKRSLVYTAVEARALHKRGTPLGLGRCVESLFRPFLVVQVDERGK